MRSYDSKSLAANCCATCESSDTPRRFAVPTMRVSAPLPTCQLPVPEEWISKYDSSPRFLTFSLKTPSDSGLRQMLPRHTNIILIGSRVSVTTAEIDVWMTSTHTPTGVPGADRGGKSHGIDEPPAETTVPRSSTQMFITKRSPCPLLSYPSTSLLAGRSLPSAILRAAFGRSLRWNMGMSGLKARYRTSSGIGRATAILH